MSCFQGTYLLKNETIIVKLQFMCTNSQLLDNLIPYSLN